MGKKIAGLAFEQILLDRSFLKKNILKGK